MSTVPTSEPPVRVYVLAQNRLVREALLRVLRKRSAIEILGESQDCRAAMEQLADTPCDVLLVDSLEILHSPLCQACMTDSGTTGRILLLGMEENPEQFLRAVRLGVRGYLLKDVSTTEVLEAVRIVAQGEAACSPKLCRILFEQVAKGPTPKPENTGALFQRSNQLTCRQRQLMALVARGMTNKEIASNLNLSEFTVRNHIHRVMAHLNADTRQQAVDVIRSGGLFPVL